jgi:hypothetical protein
MLRILNPCGLPLIKVLQVVRLVRPLKCLNALSEFVVIRLPLGHVRRLVLVAAGFDIHVDGRLNTDIDVLGEEMNHPKAFGQRGTALEFEHNSLGSGCHRSFFNHCTSLRRTASTSRTIRLG